MTPSERLARLRAVQEAAAKQREEERNRSVDNSPGEQLVRFIRQQPLRRHVLELRNMLMTGAEIIERRRIERDDEMDLQEERDGDWTR